MRCLYLLRHILGELSSADYVEVQVLYRLASVITDVGDDSVAVRKPLRLRYFRNYGEYVRDCISALLTYCVDRSNVSLRYNEHVGRSLGIYIPEGIAGLVLVDLGRGDISLDDLTK